MENNELYHHGILGQKWGVRRYQNKDGTLTSAGRARKTDDSSDDYKKAHDKKSVKTMSDSELRSRLNRLQMEQQYNKLSPSEVDRGKEFVSKSLKVVTGVATATTTALTLYNNYGKIKGIVESMIRSR